MKGTVLIIMAVILICLVPLLNSLREGSPSKMVQEGKNKIVIDGKENEYNAANEQKRREMISKYYWNPSFEGIKAVNPIGVPPEL
ncbi:MAG: hypothetical protein ACOYM3_29150 [Terrimicrobiaceae bacterium]